MNVNDAEIAWSIMRDAGYTRADTLESADIILLVTCSIRESAETKIWDKLNHIRHLKKNGKKVLNPSELGYLVSVPSDLKKTKSVRD